MNPPHFHWRDHRSLSAYYSFVVVVLIFTFFLDGTVGNHSLQFACLAIVFHTCAIHNKSSLDTRISPSINILRRILKEYGFVG